MTPQWLHADSIVCALQNQKCRSENGCRRKICGIPLAPNLLPRGSLRIADLTPQPPPPPSPPPLSPSLPPSPSLSPSLHSLSLRPIHTHTHTHTHTQHCRHCHRTRHYTHDCHRVGTVSSQVDKHSQMVLGLCVCAQVHACFASLVRMLPCARECVCVTVCVSVCVRA
jgi:hypothetical protein